MPDPIKKQIMDRFQTNMTTLVTAGTVKAATREYDVSKGFGPVPSLQFYDGPETTRAKDAVKWTCRFPVIVTVFFGSSAEKDVLVSEVQKKVEGDMTINSLGQIVDAGNEEPTTGGQAATIHRTTLRYMVEYTRKIGDPTLLT